MSEDARTAAARRHFDRWSTTYEQDRSSRWLRQAQQAALATLALTAEDVVLDLGCGTGAAVREAAPRVRRAVGFDLSEAMVDRARALAGGLDNVEFAVGDVTATWPFADGAFTALICTTAFHHFPRPLDTVAEMARVLASGGRVVIGDANGDRAVVLALDAVLKLLQRSHVGIRRPSRLAAELHEAGFAHERVQTLFGGLYALVCAQRDGALSSGPSRPG